MEWSAARTGAQLEGFGGWVGLGWDGNVLIRGVFFCCWACRLWCGGAWLVEERDGSR